MQKKKLKFEKQKIATATRNADVPKRIISGDGDSTTWTIHEYEYEYEKK